MYEQTFGTDWETIDDREEVIRRAFALGVAIRLGEKHPDELDRLNGQIETTYGQSFVNIAYQKGRSEADEIQKTTDEDEEVWNSLIDGKTVLDPPDRSEDEEDDENVDDADERNTIPAALRRVEIDSRPADSTDRVKRPSFLDGADSSDANAGPKRDGDRTVFGRSIDRVDRRARDESNDAGSDVSAEGESGSSAERNAESESANGDEADNQSRSSDASAQRERSQHVDDEALSSGSGSDESGDDT